MRLNFKTIVIVFLVALLGSSVGTFGMLSLYNKDKSETSSSLVIHKTENSEVVKSSYTEAIEKVYDTVVEINCTVQTTSFSFFGGTQISTSAGSGVIISEDGYIVTNEHVIDGIVSEDSITVKLHNNNSYTAKLVGYDTKTDLALLKIDEENLNYSIFADSDELLMGQDAIAIGNPLGLGISCSNGIVSALEKEIYINNVYLTVIQTNAAVNAGNSGGGLFDINGNLIGIVNAKKSTTSSYETSIEGMAYAIPSNTVLRIIKDIKENGYVKNRAALGVRVALQNYTNIKGVIVSEVLEGSSAQKAGLQKEDIITSINGVEVNSYADLAKVLESKVVGDTVEMVVIRNDSTITIEITLQESVN